MGWAPPRLPLPPHIPPAFAPSPRKKKHHQTFPIPHTMSESSNSPPSQHEFQQPKRKATQAGLDGHTTGRSVKRRASKACQCCRARKVRCNVTEHGAPCTNCRLDEVDCIVSESRRKKSVSHPRSTSDGPSPIAPFCRFAQTMVAMSSCKWPESSDLFRKPPIARSIHHGACQPSQNLADHSPGSGTKKTTSPWIPQAPRQPVLAASSLHATPWTASRT